MAILEGRAFPRTDRLVRLASEFDLVLGTV